MKNPTIPPQTFAEFVAWLSDAPPFYRVSQSRWLRDTRLDALVRFERLASDVMALADAAEDVILADVHCPFVKPVVAFDLYGHGNDGAVPLVLDAQVQFNGNPSIVGKMLTLQTRGREPGNGSVAEIAKTAGTALRRATATLVSGAPSIVMVSTFLTLMVEPPSPDL